MGIKRDAVATFHYSIIRVSVCWLLLLLLLPWNSFSQEYPRKEIDIDNFVQDLFAVQDEDVNYEDLYESLFQLYTNPLNLNDASREELAALYTLSEAQINSFLAYRENNGLLLSIYELQAIPSFDLPTIYKLLPFVTVPFAQTDGRTLWQRIASEPNHYFLLRYARTLEEQKGFTAPDTNTSGDISQRYLGSPGRLYARYRVSHVKDYSFGFTADKDAGEQFIWNPTSHRYGMDFVSFHANLQNRKRWKNIIVGDFQLQFGQGVVLAAGFSPGKGAETITTVRRSNLGIRPYSSVLEAGFFRGLAATYELSPRFHLTGLFSLTNRDANLINQGDTLDFEEAYINSLQTSGLHRTWNEIGAKGNIREQNWGGNLLYSSKNQKFQTGFSFLHTQFNSRLERQPNPYNLFEFNGKQNHVFGVNYTYTWRNWNLFGEWARSASGGIGGLSGVLASLSPKVEMALLYRHFDRNFHSFYANTFGENTRSINEQGMYWGIKIAPVKKVVLSAYYDQFRFPWLKFQVDAPSEGYEYLLRLAYKPTKTTLLYVQFREEQKGKNLVNNPTNLDYIVESRRRNYAINLDFAALKFLSFKSRLQFSDYQQEGGKLTHGLALVQDINLEWRRFKLSTRFALFDTDDYNNRQYVYEKDVLYSFSIPAYYNRGLRNYFLLQYQINRKIDCWIRWARTSLRDVEAVGTGLDQINQPQRTDVRMQIRYKF
ncbi:MAG: helix-hairpin-helix domain-containing protein [Bacteroidota bacterium]